VDRAMHDHMDGRSETFEVEYRIRHRDGSLRWILSCGRILRNFEGAPVRWSGIDWDITDSKRTEERESLLASIVEASSDAIISRDPEGVITSWNPGAERTYGYTREEVIGQPATFLVPPELSGEERHILQIVRDGSRVEGLETVRMRKDGGRIDVSLRAAPVRDATGAVAAISTIERDISEYREIQQRLLRVEKLAVLGQLAGGVGHELRNPLGAMKNAVYFLRMALENPEPEVAESLDVLEKEIEVATSTISSLLDFARDRLPNRQEVSLNYLLEQALGRCEILPQIELETEFGEEIPSILADPEQLIQVFGNLVRNAVDAMPQGGRLRVKSSCPEAGWAAAAIEDTGEGIAPGTMERVFEPMFTTKAKGIGLGLCISRNFVEHHGGKIEVESKPGKGTRFTVRLPVEGGA